MIDAKTQEVLRRKFNPDGSALRKAQIRMLELLIHIDRICQENNIKYWLSSGTLLGAVRHGGFIPWDDDADIEMLRDDYDRLMNILSKDTKYFLQTVDSDPAYINMFAKLRDTKSRLYSKIEYPSEYQGCWVDIFPLHKSCKISRWWSNLLYKQLVWHHFRHHPEDTRRRDWGKNIFFNKYTPLNLMISRAIPFKFLYHAPGSFFKSNRTMSDIFPLTTINFEGHSFMAPKDCDAYLTRLYGNYMQLPSLDQIVVHALDIQFFDE